MINYLFSLFKVKNFLLQTQAGVTILEKILFINDFVIKNVLLLSQFINILN